MFHIGHSTQHGQYPWIRADEAEGPGCYRLLGLTRLEFIGNGLGNTAQTASPEGFHYDYRYSALIKALVEMSGIGIAPSGIVPVQLVHLYLDEIPMIGLVGLDKLIPVSLASVEGKAKISYMSGLALREEVVKESCIYKPVLEVSIA